MRDEELFAKLRASQPLPKEADEAFFAQLRTDVGRECRRIDGRLEARARRRVPRWLVGGGVAGLVAAAAVLLLLLRPHPGPRGHRMMGPMPGLSPAEDALIDNGDDATDLVDQLDAEELKAVDVHFKGGV